MIKTVSIAIALFIALISFGSENQLIIAKANKAYSDGLYNNAADLYKKVVASGYESWELYYNLGNTFYKMNDMASAILYYEKAKKLNPGIEDVNFNLKVANSKIADKIEPLPEMFYKRWYKLLLESFPFDTWAVIAIGSMVITAFFGTLFIISRRTGLRKTGFWTAILFFLMGMVFFLFSYQGYQSINNNSEAIVFSPTITIKSSPDEKSIDLFVLHEGTKVKILDNIGNWFEIRIANGSVGWLPSSSLERI